MSLLRVSAEDHELEHPSLEDVAQQFDFAPPAVLAGLKLLFHVVLPAVDSIGVDVPQCHAVSFLL